MEPQQLQNGIEQLIAVTEQNLSLKPAERPDFDIFDTDRRTWEQQREQYLKQKSHIARAIANEMHQRRMFLTDVIAQGAHQKQTEVLRVGQEMCSNPKRSERQRIMLEYEFAYLGANVRRNETFTPFVLRYLSQPDLWKEIPERLMQAIDPVHFSAGCDVPVEREQHDYEYCRWHHSNDDYSHGVADFTTALSYHPERFEGLTDDLEEFLRGKRKILEIGFLHQHIHDQIHRIVPEMEYHGVDLSITAVALARKKGITAFNANAYYAIPYPDRFFDGIVMSTVKAAGLYHNPEMWRVLKDPTAILEFHLQ